MNSVSQLLQLAIQNHQAGNLHHAELFYQQILEIDPRNFDALHLTGLLAHQVGRNDLAVNNIKKALRLNPEFPSRTTTWGLLCKIRGNSTRRSPAIDWHFAFVRSFSLRTSTWGML